MRTCPVIPPTLLGKWTLLVGTIALLNGAQNFIKPSFSRKVYTLAGANVTPLSARCFGTWNITSAIIRIYAAYNLSNPQYVRPALISRPAHCFVLPAPCADAGTVLTLGLRARQSVPARHVVLRHCLRPLFL